MTENRELPVGRIAGLFGIRGELKCDPTTAGRTLFFAGERLRLSRRDGTSSEIELATVREHKGRLLIRLPGIESANDAQLYVGATFYADPRRIALEAGEYLDRDLVGCVLFNEDGTMLGQVERVEHYPSSDMLVVSGRLVPMVQAFIKSIDTANRRIVVDLPRGLLNDEEADEA